ncbi:hypothetical protein K469DRAFT_701270 [Zopfia rhizophila CBS 207.26]|uniref:F-box domain-containing protein n=1 Tax=Zopfia rhizophila CBS 207.26 TaxID=1314779 RepID=A0A6A6D941_9PEZI|nr:hypothetical protein K469DRAFT_701270 [Zopfia rhizophila CBS 207.26]
MVLLHLPPEILDEIISLTLPSGIEAFALCCKAVNARAASQIQRHNTLKRQWKYTAHNSARRGDTLRMLYEISRDSLVALYIESLNLWDRRQLGNVSRDPRRLVTGDFVNFRADEEAMERIRAMVMGSEYLENAGVDAEEWWGKMMKEDEAGDEDYDDAPYTVVSLLGLLPNLKTLQLPHRWYDVRPFENAKDDVKRLVSVLDAIVESSNGGNDSEKPLEKLETMLPFMPAGYEERAGLQCVQPFMPLKSMRELYAVSCLAVDDQYTGIPFQWRFPELNSPLRRVELAYCCMDADGISLLLSHTPSLAVFRYSHQTKWHGCQHDWNPGTFSEAIARHCGKTITELAITVDELYGDICNGASSFLSFPNLQTLEVDVCIFCGPPVESGQERGMYGRVPEGEIPWTEEDIPCLGSMLPESVIEVQINTDFPKPDVVVLKLLLKNLREQREIRLKKLGKVIVWQDKEDSARTLVESAGAAVCVFSPEGTQTRSRSMMPAWKREFEERVGGLEFT